MTNTPWEILGPGGGGALYYPTISPHDPDIVLASCDMTCSFITLDGGKSWTELNFRDNARCFAHDPKRPGVMYAGSQGLYRTVDGGKSWNLIFPDPAAVTSRTFIGDHANEVVASSDNWPGWYVWAIAIDPVDSGTLYIGILGSAGIGIWRSSDAGAHWSQIGQMQSAEFFRIQTIGGGDIVAVSGSEMARFSGQQMTRSQLDLPEGRQIQDFAFSAEKGTGAPVFYAATGSRWDGGTFHSGLYKSVDCAKTWEEISGGLDRDVSAGETREINRVAACATDPNVVYASIKEPYQTNTKYFGILKSADGGKSWDWVLRIDDKQPGNRTPGWVEKDYGTDWAGAPFWMGVSPSDPDICYATDWGTVYKTTDGGATWQQLYTNQRPDGSWQSRGVDVTNVYDVAFDPFDKGHLLMPCTDTGLMASRDGGQGWLHAQTGVPAAWVNTCYFALFDPEVKGRVWSAWANCHDLPRQKMMKKSLETYKGGVCKSDDGTALWSVSNAGMPESCLVTHLVLDPKSKPGARTLWAAAFGKGVYKSTDDGATWALKNNGIEGNLNAWRMLLAPSGKLYLLVAGSTEGGTARDGALYCSDDKAESWRKLSLPAGVFYANDIELDPRNPDRLYVACWGSENGYPERCGGLYVSEDAGKSWRALLDSSLHVYGITVTPDDPQILYATAYEGRVLRSNDGGKTWTDLPGIDFHWPKKVQPDPADPGMIYVTTFGSCVWHGPAQGCARELGNVSVAP